MTPWKHAESTARKWGGSPSDYVHIHDWFDETKQFTGDWTHRALRHHSAGIQWAIDKFGHVVVNSKGHSIPVMNAEPINKSLYDKLKAQGVNRVKLCFSGGSDEGFLDVFLYPEFDYTDEEARNLLKEVENWAWGVYSYSGAGEGNDYGDNITYDLVENTVETEEWYMERTYGDSSEGELVVEDEE